MNWQKHRELAQRLRDQALADLLAARLALRLDTFDIGGHPTTFAHAALAKCQQTCEKSLKGFLLWHDPSYDPAIGHEPLKTVLSSLRHPGHVKKLLYSANKIDPQLVKNICALEELAPGRFATEGLDLGKPLPLHVIPQNSEYPYWSNARLVTPAESLSIRYAAQAIKTAHALLRTLAASEPRAYCAPISDFLDVYRISTALGTWPR